MSKRKKQKHAFTLIELLVVIAIIALLMSIIVPSMGKAKEHARAVICKSNLKQWASIFEMYLNDHNNHFMPGHAENHDGRYMWLYILWPYYHTGDFRLCPSANRPISDGGRMPLAAWDLTMHPAYPGHFSVLTADDIRTGSYGINWWVNDSDKIVNGDYPVKDRWRTGGQKGASNIPVLSDSGFVLNRPKDTNLPPATAEEFDNDMYFQIWDSNKGMSRVCHDRHKGGVNVLFMDWSVDHVGVKELWRLKWNQSFDTSVYYTIDWPDWMKNL